MFGAATYMSNVSVMRDVIGTSQAVELAASKSLDRQDLLMDSRSWLLLIRIYQYTILCIGRLYLLRSLRSQWRETTRVRANISMLFGSETDLIFHPESPA